MTTPARLKITFGFLLFVLQPIVLMAVASVDSDKKKLILERLPFHSLLARASVNALVEGPNGYLWLATSRGLFRFDGYGYQHFVNPLGEQSRTQQVMTLHKDIDDHLWLGTSGGQYIFDLTTQQFSQPKTLGQIQGMITSTLLDRTKQQLWIAVINKKIYRYDIRRDELIVFNAKQIGLKEGAIFLPRFSLSPSGDIWLTNYKRILRFDANAKSFKSLALRDESSELIEDAPTAIYWENKQTLWLAMQMNNIYRATLDDTDIGTEIAFKKICGEKLLPYIESLKRTKDGRFWAMSSRYGLFLYDKSDQCFNPESITWLDATDRSELLPSGMLEDSKGRFWFLHQNSLVWHDPIRVRPTFIIDEHKPGEQGGLSGDFILSNYQDSKGNEWYGTYQRGLNYRPATQTSYEQLSKNGTNSLSLKLPDYTVWSMNEDSQGRLWFGTTAGLGIYDLNTQTNIDQKNSQWQVFAQLKTPIRAIAFWQEFVFFALRDGLGVFNKKTNTYRLLTHNKQRQDSLADNFTYDVVVDQQGDIWVGTANGLSQLISLEQGTFKNYMRQEVQHMSTIVASLHVDRRFVWFGRFDGLFRFDKQSEVIDYVPTPLGAQGDSVYAIESDRYDRLWVSNASGINRLDKDELRFTTYGLQDGVPSKTYVTNSSQLRRNGDLVFGSVKGWIKVSPEKPIKNPSAVTRISKMSTNKQVFTELQGQTSMQLKANTQTIEFELTTLDYSQASAIRFRYRRDDADWQYLDASHRLKLVDVESGQYRLTFNAGQNGVWSDQNRDLLITIAKPWWQSYWFILLAVVLATMVIYILIRIKTQLLQQRNRYLRQQVAIRTQELEERNVTIESLLKQKDQWISNISHEFKTPLTLILSPIEQAINAGQNVNPEYLPVIRRNGQRLLRMVNQFLALVANKKRQDQKPICVDVVKSLSILVAEFESLANSKHIALSFTSPVVLKHAYTYLAEDYLDIIVLNLLSNAFKYTPPGGRINCHCELRDQQRLVIIVSDTGPGIPKARQASIFNRFERANDTCESATAGAGIGLALVKSLVETWHGTISVDSEPGEGSRFMVELPSFYGDKENVAQKQRTSHWLAQEKHSIAHFQDLNHYHHRISGDDDYDDGMIRLLIVEDNPELSQYLYTELSNYFFCQVAPNGEEGIRLAKQNIPDLIISDLMMPKMNGYDLAKTLKSNALTDHIPIVLLTAMEDKEHRIKGFEEKVDDYLIKPFDIEELVARIQNLIANRDLLKKRYAVTLAGSDIQKSQADLSLGSDDSLASHPFIEKVNAILEQHYQDTEFNVARLSELLYMVDRQLRRKMNAIIDISPSEYIRNFRLSKAIVLIEQDVPLNKIPALIGLQSYPYFVKCFKEKYGTAPSKFSMDKPSMPVDI